MSLGSARPNVALGFSAALHGAGLKSCSTRVPPPQVLLPPQHFSNGRRPQRKECLALVQVPKRAIAAVVMPCVAQRRLEPVAHRVQRHER